MNTPKQVRSNRTVLWDRSQNSTGQAGFSALGFIVTVFVLIGLVAGGLFLKRSSDNQQAQLTALGDNATLNKLTAKDLTTEKGQIKTLDVTNITTTKNLTVTGASNLADLKAIKITAASASISGSLSAAALFGDGSNLTNLSATNISTGRLSDTRLSANVALLNSTQTFSGVNTFSRGLSSQGHLTGTTGAFSGNVSGANAINVNEFVTLGQLTTVSAGNYFIQNGNSYGALATLGTNDAFSLAFETAGLERTRIDTNGNVGIGTTAPVDKLDVAGHIVLSGSGSRLRRDVDSSSLALLGGISKGTGARLELNGDLHPTIPGEARLVTKGSGAFILENAALGSISGSELLRVTSAGNVGIGTTSPVAKLQINTQASSGVADPLAVSLGGIFGTSAIGKNLKLKLFDSGTSSSDYGLGISTNLLEITTGSNAAIAFFKNHATTPVELMRITNAGNVGIGTTSPGATLDVKGAGGATFASGLKLSNGAGGNSWLLQAGSPSVNNNYFTLTDLTAGNAVRLTVNDSGNVGIGTTAPAQKLDITGGNLRLDSTSFASQTGIIYKDATRFLHNFNYGNNGTVTTSGNNVFLGLNSGNFTMGSTATATWHGSYNTGVGQNTLQNNTTGDSNSAVGIRSLQNNTTGYQNSAVGSDALFSNTTGHRNSAMGANALYNNTTGYQNAAMGMETLYNNTTGYHNSALGYNAGRYIADGTTANQTSNTSLYLGTSTKASANGNANEIVIGYNTTGNGSNSVTLGNTSITKTILQGNVGIGETAPGAKLQITTGAAGTIGQIIKAAASQTADLLQLQNSSGTVLSAFNKDGSIGVGVAVPTQKLEVNGGIRLNTATAKPTCDSTTRGTIWFTQNGAGVKDNFEVCAKDAADAYAWRAIY